MNHPFPLYTACFGQDFIHDTGRNGMGCTIVGELKMRADRNGDQAAGYRVLWDDGVEALVKPGNLRRREQRRPERRSRVATGLRRVLNLFKEKEAV